MIHKIRQHQENLNLSIVEANLGNFDIFSDIKFMSFCFINQRISLSYLLICENFVIFIYLCYIF